MKGLIDYFAIIGLGEKLLPQNPELFNEKKSITNIDLYYGYGGNKIELLSNKDEKWIDLDGSKTVWLKVTYNQKGAPITHIDIIQAPLDKRKLKIDAKLNMYPVPLKRLGDETTDHKFEGMDEEFAYYSGNYDLTEILGFEKRNGYNTVFCYKTQNKTNYNSPLEDINVTVCEKKVEETGVKINMNLTKNYDVIKRHFGRSPQNCRFVIYKRAPSVLENRYAALVIDKYPPNKKKGEADVSDAISMFCFPKGISLSRTMREPAAFSFVLTKEDGARTYGSAIVFDEELPSELEDKVGHIEIDKKNPLYTQKAICLISHYPFLDEFKDTLKQIYQMHMSKNRIPIERVICNLVDETPIPDKGRVAVQIDIGQPIIFKRPLCYPHVSDTAIQNLFTALSIGKVISLFECVLLERKILFISKYRSLLTDVAQALTSLVFPFQWTQVLIPILPEHLSSYIEAPFPYIIGLYLEENEDFEFSADDIVKVYLDTSEIIWTENNPPMPEKYFKRLVKRLEPFAYLHDDYKKKLENCDFAFQIKSYDPDDSENQVDTYEIRDAFFSFVTSILKYYLKFFTPPKAKKDEFLEIKDLFNVEGFLIARKANKPGNFLARLVETRLFTYFIETRAFSKSFEAEYKFFDQCIKNKRTKKEPKFIVPARPEKTVKTYLPNEEDLPAGQFFRYKTFDKLNPLYFVPARPTERIATEQEGPPKPKIIDMEQLILMDETKWSKFLMEMMYTLWFMTLNIKLKSEPKEYFKKITEYAHVLFEQLRNKGVKPNETIYRNLIESCCSCGMNDKALEIVTKLKDSKTEISPFAHGVYLEAISKARDFKFDSEKLEETKESESAPKEDQNSSVEKISIFILSTKCKNCSETLFAEDIISGWKRSYNDYITQCPYCSQSFTAEIKVVQQSESFQFETEFYMLSPLVVRKEFDLLIKNKGINNMFNDKFDLNHKHVYWNIYLYASLIKAPTFFLERQLSQMHIEEHLKNIDKKIQAHVEESKIPPKPFSIFRRTSQIVLGKPPNGNASQKHENSGNSDGAKQHQSDGDNSASGEPKKGSSLINMVKSKDTKGKTEIKKMFGELLDELRENMEKKMADYEVEVKAKKSSENSQFNSDFLEGVQDQTQQLSGLQDQTQIGLQDQTQIQLGLQDQMQLEQNEPNEPNEPNATTSS